MPLNIPGLLAPIQLLWYPRVIVPSLVVKDIRQLDFAALKRAGFRGAVFDKDNCLTIPHKDELVPELDDAWKECRTVFGKGNVLIVSNTAGTHLDGGGIQAESVAYHLDVPVLMHVSMKPSYSCINSIRQYFASLPVPIPDDQLVVVGDRILTDIVLANRMRTWLGWRPFVNSLFRKGDQQHPVRGPLSIWTTGIWKKEAIALRWGEGKLLELVSRWSRRPPSAPTWDVSGFIKQQPVTQPVQAGDSGIASILSVLRLW